MKSDYISLVEIDELERLRVYPVKEKFSMIWRTATEVHWDEKNLFLYSPKPREWSYFNWFLHMMTVVKKEYNCKLTLSTTTQWINITTDLQEQIIASYTIIS